MGSFIFGVFIGLLIGYGITSLVLKYPDKPNGKNDRNEY